MTQHTPGPWRLDEMCGDRVVIGGDGKYVCHIHKSERTPRQHERAEANIALIAAAPELLGAMKQIAAHLGSPESIRFIAEAAIALTEGKQP